MFEQPKLTSGFRIPRAALESATLPIGDSRPFSGAEQTACRRSPQGASMRFARKRGAKEDLVFRKQLGRLGAPALGFGKFRTPPNRYPPARLPLLLAEATPAEYDSAGDAAGRRPSRNHSRHAPPAGSSTERRNSIVYGPSASLSICRRASRRRRGCSRRCCAAIPLKWFASRHRAADRSRRRGRSPMPGRPKGKKARRRPVRRRSPEVAREPIAARSGAAAPPALPPHRSNLRPSLDRRGSASPS